MVRWRPYTAGEVHMSMILFFFCIVRDATTFMASIDGSLQWQCNDHNRHQSAERVTNRSLVELTRKSTLNILSYSPM